MENQENLVTRSSHSRRRTTQNQNPFRYPSSPKPPTSRGGDSRAPRARGRGRNSGGRTSGNITDNGEIIDCIDIYKQPSLANSLITDLQYAVVTNEGSSYHGASGVFNLWNPKTEDNEVSLSQIWVVTSYDKDNPYNNLNSIEVGWMRDGYKTTGCYDLNCKGFVQTNGKFSFGMPMRVSIYGGQSMEVSINVFKDKTTRDKWWLQVEGSIVGYWPVDMFTDLKNSANSVEWGGEIMNRRTNGHHTTTQMGSGEFPNKGFSKSCFIHSLKVIDSGLVTRDPGYLEKTISKPACYDLTLTKNSGSSFKTHIFYGGPGFSPTCQ
ncbi:uncharacterized protein LOC124944971 [Impatiens glandulifera]|uniref:uncharacterized protein LOC124944971 n=1 Tax=Impatiens glandulifera TaxID=253017 RepID=UPI001FB15CD9|nr:uncharacterized protein LOC124944971 [Impatiens glandulifera]